MHFMTAALSSMLIGLAASAVPATAREGNDVAVSIDAYRAAPEGPIVRAVGLEASRLAESHGQPAPASAAGTGRRVATGAAIGFGIGAVLGMTVGQEACLNEPRWHCAKVGAPFAIIGAVIGWLRK